MINTVYDYIRFKFSIFPGINKYKSAHFLREYYDFRQGRQGLLRIALNCIVYGLFGFYVGFRSYQVAARWEKSARWRRWSASVGARHFTDPNDLAMFNIKKRKELFYTYRRFEHIGCGRFIDEKMASDPTLFHDKFAFARFCSEHGIPHPRVFAHIHDGQLDSDCSFDDQQVVVAKPTYGTGGKGVFEINLEDAALLGDEGHRRLIERMISGHPGPYILQERIYPTSDIADLAIDGLPTARVTTMLNERGEPEIVTSVMRFPTQTETIADNAHLGGPMSAIDIETGELSRARYRSRPGEISNHPLNSSKILGRRLTKWHEIKQIALDAHKNFLHDFVQIGWDIGLADQPVVLEINARPDLAIAQRASNELIGHSRYGELISFHISKRIAQLQRAEQTSQSGIKLNPNQHPARQEQPSQPN